MYTYVHSYVKEFDQNTGCTIPIFQCVVIALVNTVDGPFAGV
jgi:hypothetical protein